MTTIGIIGAGNIGSHVARVAIAAGYDIVIANSRGPETLDALIADLGPRARAATAADAAAAGDFAVVTIPFKNIDALPVDALAGKIVIDTNNYYFERDGRIPAIEDGTATVTGMLQAVLPTSRVAKGFNHIHSTHIVEHAQPTGTSNRRALATASDHDDAIELVTGFFDRVGFDTVVIGGLDESWRIDRDQPGYGPRLTADELRASLAKAVR